MFKYVIGISVIGAISLLLYLNEINELKLLSSSGEYSPDREAIPMFINPNPNTDTDIVANESSESNINRLVVTSDIRKFSNTAQIIYRDRYYNKTNLETVREIVRRWKEYSTKHDFEYIFETFDCDNFAYAFKGFVSTLNIEMGLNFMVGTATLENKNEFAFIPGGDGLYHMLNVFVVNNEIILVIEPQNGILTVLEKYPNRDNFFTIEF